jgi:class 3 adenylate cyclase
VKYDELTKSAFDSQLDRIEKLRSKIASRDMVVKPGKVIPDDADLAIGTGRRLDAAVLFIDISDFSSRLSNTLEEQERLLRLLTFFFSEMIAIVEEYGGFVEKNTGDGLMAYFEDRPGKPDENGSRRALACALTMFYTTDKVLNPVVLASSMEPLRFRAGIEWGSITVAQVGKAKGYNSIVAVGTPANLASKMLNFAKAGEIVIGTKLMMQLPPSWWQWCEKIDDPSGFVYVASGNPYDLYRYNGRWKDPIDYSSLLALLAGPPKPPPAIPPPPGWPK